MMRGPWMALALGAAFIAGPAWAVPGPFLLTLDNVTFDDGGIASGAFLVNSYGYISTPRDLETTAGSTFAGASYVVGMPAGNTAQTFDFFLGDYSGGLHLEVVAPLDAGSPDALALGGTSYECIDQCATVRQITGGSLLVTSGTNPDYVPPDQVSEPASLSLLGFGLVGLGAARRRR